jgi:SET domain-containing protein
MIKPYLLVEDIPGKGRGVFTMEDIPAQTVVEISPVIVLPAGDRPLLDKTLLHDYIFEWGNQCCMALGIIPMYNHSYRSNCEYFMDYEDETIMVKTVSKIRKGEELTINYNGDWNSRKKVWFDVK